MKKKNTVQNNKLHLNKETISALHPSDADQVRGGAKNNSNYCSFYCHTGGLDCPTTTWSNHCTFKAQL